VGQKIPVCIAVLIFMRAIIFHHLRVESGVDLGRSDICSSVLLAAGSLACNMWTESSERRVWSEKSWSGASSPEEKQHF